MPGKVAKIGTFSDWIGLFDEWRKEIGVNRDEIASFKFRGMELMMYSRTRRIEIRKKITPEQNTAARACCQLYL